MEEYSKGRVEDTQKVEADEEEKEVVLKDSQGVEFVRDIAAVNETPGGEDFSSSNSSWDKEENSEEKVVSDSVGVSSSEELSQDMEPSVEKWGDSEVAELDAKETEENISPSLDHTKADSPILTGLNKETEQLSSAETTRDSQLLTDVRSKEIDKETTLQGSVETNGSTVDGVVAAQGITVTKIPASDNNAGNSSSFPKPNVEENAPTVETRDAGELVNKRDIHESMENQSIISLPHRQVQPTSWKSCCGLFEVLRRSDR